MKTITTLTTSKRVFEDSVCYAEVEVEGAYFDVIYGQINDGLNLVVNRKVASYQERQFEDRVIGELEYLGHDSCSVFSPFPLNFTNLRRGYLIYGYIRKDGEDFGPFHQYRYVRKEVVDR